MFGDVDRRAAIFAAQRQPLRDAQQQDDGGRGEADRRRRWRQADAGGGDAHQRDGDEEGVFAPQPIAEIAEQDRA